jgi:hypothetical protein
MGQLVKSRHVTDAQDPDLAKGRENLLTEARDLIRIYRAGSGFPKVNKKQRSGKRQRATAIARSKAEAEIAAKIGKASTTRSKHFTSDGDEKKLRGPLEGEISNNRITVTAEPWVSPEDVRREFESLRDIWFWNPTPSERRVELVRFVTGFCEGYHNEERGVSGLVPGPNWRSWRHIMEQWNQSYLQEHDWHYKDVRNFRRDFLETFEALTLFKDF